jgi:hypothetical protein
VWAQPATAPGGDDSTGSQTEQDQLERLLLQQRAPAPTVAPQREPQRIDHPTRVGLPAATAEVDRDVLGPLPGEPRPQLLREGAYLVDRSGRLGFDDRTGRPMFLPLPASAETAPGATPPDADAADAADAQASTTRPLPPMILQPSRLLQSLEAAQAQHDGPLLFTLSGQVHQYRDQNYLLPTSLSSVLEADPDASAADPPDPPVTADVADDPADDPDRLMRGLMGAARPAAGAQRGTRLDEAAGPGGSSRTAAPGPPGMPQAIPRREGSLLVRRAGRVTRSPDGREIVFVLDADDPDAPEPPLVLLANQMRRTMEDAVAERGDRAVFLVTGQVYTYRGGEYLLVTAMQQPVDRGNLR